MSQYPFNAKRATRVTPAKNYDEKKRVIRPGTMKNPVNIRVQTRERHDEIAVLCLENQWVCHILIDAEQEEDTSQLEILKNKPASIVSDKRAGRNKPCLCGSGKKYKKCCARLN